MSLNNASSGLFNAVEYQAPGFPWLTSSAANTTPSKLNFFKVTRGITVRNLGATPLHIGFTQLGVTATGSNRYTIPASTSERLEIRTAVLWLQAESGTANYSILAELTLIDAKMMPELTGSTLSGSGQGFGWQGVG